MNINKNEITILIFIIIIMYMYIDSPITENLWIGQNPNINPKCNHVKEFKKPYVSRWNISNYSDAYDCYNKCINEAECQYVGLSFDCYNNCFNNVEFPGNTLGDYNQ